MLLPCSRRSRRGRRRSQRGIFRLRLYAHTATTTALLSIAPGNQTTSHTRIFFTLRCMEGRRRVPPSHPRFVYPWRTHATRALSFSPPSIAGIGYCISSSCLSIVNKCVAPAAAAKQSLSKHPNFSPLPHTNHNIDKRVEGRHERRQ